MTYEITGSTKDQRDFITGRIGLLRITWERLDGQTYNATIDDVEADTLTDYLEACDNISYRLI